MPTRSFNTRYDEYTKDSMRKIAVEQYKTQLRASILLTQLREMEGYTQKELAEKCGKSQATIARIENGNMNVTFDTLAEIVNATGHKIDFIIAQ